MHTSKLVKTFNQLPGFVVVVPLVAVVVIVVVDSPAVLVVVAVESNFKFVPKIIRMFKLIEKIK